MKKLPEAERRIRRLESKRKWRLNNLEASRAASRAYGAMYRQSENGKNVRCEAQKRRYRNDPELHRLKAIGYRHKITPELLMLIRDRDKICQFCGSKSNLTFDHKHPISRGGKSTIDNLQILCGPCNQFKNDRLFLPGGGMIVSL